MKEERLKGGSLSSGGTDLERLRSSTPTKPRKRSIKDSILDKPAGMADKTFGNIVRSVSGSKDYEFGDGTRKVLSKMKKTGGKMKKSRDSAKLDEEMGEEPNHFDGTQSMTVTLRRVRGEFTLSKEDAEEVAKNFRAGIRVKKKKLQYRTVHVFTGRKAVNWLVKNVLNINRKIATKIGHILKQGQVFDHVDSDQIFKDTKNFYYRFLAPEEEDFTWLEQGVYGQRPPLKFSTSQLGKGDTIEVPSGPLNLPYFGNAQRLHITGPQQSISQLSKSYGPCFRFKIFNADYVVISDPELVEQIVDASNPCFGKYTENEPVFKSLKSFRGEGLTTISDGKEHDYHQKCILGGFSSNELKRRFEDVKQVVLKTMKRTMQNYTPVDWKYWTKNIIFQVLAHVALSLDCDDPIFKKLESGIQYLSDKVIDRAYRPKHPDVTIHNPTVKKKTNKIFRIIDQIIQDRKRERAQLAVPADQEDLLDKMLQCEHLTDDIIRSQVLTLLSAGNATTGSMLAWCTYLLIQNYEEQFPLFREIDTISGGDLNYDLQYKDLKELKYTSYCLYEALRIYAPLPSVIRNCVKDTTIGNYKIRAGDSLMICILAIHRNPKIWPNPEIFNPSRFEPDKVKDRSPFSFIPWIAGPRQCIGRQVAMMMSKVIMFYVFNHFTFTLASQSSVVPEEILFLRPKKLKIVPRPRKKRHAALAQTNGSVDKGKQKEDEVPGKSMMSESYDPDAPFYVLYGSNLGTAHGFAENIGDQALAFGIMNTQVMSLDEFLAEVINEKTKLEGSTIVICCATYNGLPPDNCKLFHKWISSEPRQVFQDVRFCIFGCGNTQWQQTYQKVPKMLQSRMIDLGAVEFFDRGEGDADTDIDEDFEEWIEQMWLVIPQDEGQEEEQQKEKEPIQTREKQMNLKQMKHMQVSKSMRRIHAEQLASNMGNPTSRLSSFSTFHMPVAIVRDSELTKDVLHLHSVAVNCPTYTCKIIVNRELHGKASDRSARHVEIKLQQGMDFVTGDHLGVCPKNSTTLVHAMCQLFQIDLESVFVLQSNTGKGRNRGFLPKNTPLLISNILYNVVDLRAIPKKTLLSLMFANATDDEEKAVLSQLSSTTKEGRAAYKQWSAKRYNVIETLKLFPSCDLNFTEVLELLTPIKPRYYSISSSPKKHPGEAHISVGVVREDLEDNRVYHGVSSSYIASLKPGQHINCFVRSAESSHFYLPDDDRIPIIMVGAGTGMSPYRGFLQEREARAENKAVGNSTLYFGCRHPDQDYIYQEELESLTEKGILTDLHLAFSRISDSSERCYVQDRIYRTADFFWDTLFNKGGILYICGSGNTMGKGVNEILLKIAEEKLQSKEKAEAFLQQLTDERRYLKDVWG